jgi:hypothetical protein
MKDRERLVKAKDYAERQRKLNKDKRTGKKADDIPECTHLPKVRVVKEPSANTMVPIQEETPSEVSQPIHETNQYDDMPLASSHANRENMMMQIDQEELEKLGVRDKHDVEDSSLTDVHQYSLL